LENSETEEDRSEPQRDNDPKGIGPFILASLEMQEQE
jgi:hypothetical protein